MQPDIRSTEGFTTLDAVLAEQGVCEVFEAVAIKEVQARQIDEAALTGGHIEEVTYDQN